MTQGASVNPADRPAPPRTGGTAPIKPADAAAPPMARGARGQDVRAMQDQLKKAGFNPGKSDGIFGPKTEKALKDFQKSKGFEAQEAKLAKLGISKEHLKAEAEKNGVPSRMVLAVIQKESGGRPRLTSRAGAQGLMQLMPGTARSLGVKNAMDPKQNVAGGSPS